MALAGLEYVPSTSENYCIFDAQNQRIPILGHSNVGIEFPGLKGMQEIKFLVGDSTTTDYLILGAQELRRCFIIPKNFPLPSPYSEGGYLCLAKDV